jgi:hypothetical protein
VVSAAWLLATLGAFGLALGEVLRPPGSWIVRTLLFLGLVCVFVALQYAAFFGMLVINYCENCAGRPLTARDVAAAGVLLAPTAIVWIVVLLWRLKRRQNRADSRPPAA